MESRSSDADPAVRIAGLGASLRQREVDVSIRDELDAAVALTLIDAGDRAEVRLALLSALRIRPADRETFDLAFAAWWSGRSAAEALRDVHISTRSEHLRARRDTRALLPGLKRTRPSSSPDGEPGYTAAALLRRKPFDEYSDRDRAEMERLLQRMVRRLATRRSRRLVPTRSRGEVDLRRSFRRLLATHGEPLSLARRARAVDQPRLVLLCDTSGSMDPYARFLLAFVLSLRRAARRTEIFAFNTNLTRLTKIVSPQKPGPTLDRLGEAVPDWSGGTRIGECLATFVADWMVATVDSRTVVVILSDGLDRGEPDEVERAMRAIGRRARKVIWLNPLMGDDRYRPTARGMSAALPFVDELLPAHDLESLERLLPILAA